MNALLKFQAQQEDQFLQSILAHDFEQLCAEHVDFFQNNLQPQFDYYQCKRPLNPIPILIRFRFPAVWQ